MKFMPRDQWGRRQSIEGDGWAIVWEWPTNGMIWFCWNWTGMYRLGPVSFHRFSYG